MALIGIPVVILAGQSRLSRVYAAAGVVGVIAGRLFPRDYDVLTLIDYTDPLTPGTISRFPFVESEWRVMTEDERAAYDQRQVSKKRRKGRKS